MTNAIVKLNVVSVVDLVVRGELPEEIDHIKNTMKFCGVLEWLKREAQLESMKMGQAILLKKPNYDQRGTTDYQIVICDKERSVRDLALCICQQFRTMHSKDTYGNPNSMPMEEDSYMYPTHKIKLFARKLIAEAYCAVLEEQVVIRQEIIKSIKGAV